VPPAEGSLVMSLSLNPAETKLGMWTRWSSNFGLVIRADGAVAGFSPQRGRFMLVSDLRPVLQEIVQNGFVNRPRLGVSIEDVGPDDLERFLFPALGDIPLIRVKDIIKDSPADHAHLQPGDLILSFADRPVADRESFADAILAARRGPSTMKILRQDEIISVTVDLENLLRKN
jgi:S1-C subfamily serine protease